MLKSVLPVLVLALSFSGIVRADDNAAPADQSKTTLKVEDAADKKNKVDGDVDQELTNAKLRAESGSKSRYSLSFTGNYNGASLEKPFDKDRPNTTGDKIAQRVYMNGSFSGRYRIDKNQSLQLGIGYQLQRPFQDAKYGEVSDPYVDYNFAGKIGKVQNVADVEVIAATSNDETTVGQLGQLYASDTVMYDFNGSRFSLGLSVEGTLTAYDKNPNSLVRMRGDDNFTTAGSHMEQEELAAYPLAEYEISDKLQLRTVFRPWIFGRAPGMDSWTFYKHPWTQSLGLGWAVTRDVYLYPNFQWDWEQWRGKDYSFAQKQVRANSTVGLSATVNIF